MLRIPESPPELSELIEEVQTSGRLVEILSAESPAESKPHYYHWDKLRHLEPPAGLNHRDWWLSLKLRRSTVAKQIPLQAINKDPFVYVQVDPIPERLHEIDLHGGGTIAMPDAITNPETKDRYLINSLIEEAITSSQLEGAATTREVAREMIRTNRRPKDRSEQMIMNNFWTMQQIGKLRTDQLSKEMICQLHRLVTRDTLDDPSMAGQFRRREHKIDIGDDFGQVFHKPPPNEELDDRISSLCDFANGKTPEYFLHPVIRSIILHFWLAYDHPFVDGNGRTARALFYWSMLHHGFWLCEFISISEIILRGPSKYGRAFLYSETDGNDLTYFVVYHLEVIRRAFDQLHEYIKRKTEELNRLERELRGMRFLNHRQQAMISHALRHPYADYTFQSHRISHGVVYQTARTDLLDLSEKRLLKSRKIGREWHFSPVEDLESALQSLQA